MATQDSRIRLKRSTVSGATPDIGPSSDHTDGTWTATDIYVGEPYLNTADNQVWVGFDSAPHCIYGHAKLALSAAQIRNGNTTPIAFGLNVPAGYFAQVIDGVWLFTEGATPFDVGTEITIQGDVSAQYLLRGATINAGDQFTKMYNSGTVGVCYVIAGDLYAMVDADSTVGDGTGAIYLTYMLIPV